jgi:hypothetical protein
VVGGGSLPVSEELCEGGHRSLRTRTRRHEPLDSRRVGNPSSYLRTFCCLLIFVSSWDGNRAQPGTSLVSLSFCQNMPLALARGMFGAMSGAEFWRVPTSCKVSQCSTALPSAFIR